MRSSLIATLKHVTLFTSDVLEVGLRAIVEQNLHDVDVSDERRLVKSRHPATQSG